MAESIF